MVHSHLRVFFSQKQETAIFFLTSVNILANPHINAIDFVCAVLCGKIPDEASLVFPAGCEKNTASVNRPEQSSKRALPDCLNLTSDTSRHGEHVEVRLEERIVGLVSELSESHPCRVRVLDEAESIPGLLETEVRESTRQKAHVVQQADGQHA